MRLNVGNIALFVLLTCLALLWFLPILWTFATSLRPELDIHRQQFVLLPTTITLENWAYVFQSSNLFRWFLNSMIVTTTHTVLQLTICSMAAYAIARLDFYGRKIIFGLILAGLMVPGSATFIPVYLLFANLHLHNTYIALILPGAASSFAVFLMTQFFRGIPKELEEAAFIDGASHFLVFRRIILPLGTPVLTTIAIFTFVGNWNDYLWPKISATRPDVMTLTVGLQALSQSWHFDTFYGRMMAALWLGTLPAIIVYVLFQQRIVKGINMTSGIKG